MNFKNSFRFAFLLLLLVSLVCSSCSSPSEQATSEGQIGQDVHSESPQIAEYVVDVFQDSKGNFWMGTMSRGVARWDGKELVYFSTADGMCGETVSSVQEDKDGNIWFNSHTGICFYDGKEFSTVSKSSGRHDDKVGWRSQRIDAEGNKWTSSNAGIILDDGEKETAFVLPTRKENIHAYAIAPGRGFFYLKDSKGNLWFKTDGDGAYRYDGQNFTHFTKETGLCSNMVNAIEEDGQGRIWFLCMQAYQPEETGDGGACIYDPAVSSEPSLLSILQFPEVEGLSGGDLYSLTSDSKGQIWIGATGLGVYRHDGSRFHLYKGTDRMDLTYNMGVQAILEDVDGRMWFGFSGGLFRLIDGSIVNVTQDGPWG